MKLSLNQLKNLVSEKLDIIDVLYKYNPDGHYQEGQTCFCPFHDNENTPAASIYNNEGITTLWCFSEKKLYTAADAIEILLKVDIYKVADQIWQKMTDIEKQEWLKGHAETNYKDLFVDNKPEEQTSDYDISINKLSHAFRSGKITIYELLKAYIKLGGIK